MATATGAQFAAAAMKAGFKDQDLIDILCIRYVEDGSGRLDIQDYAGSGHYGPWQISTNHGYTPAQLADLQTNANAAFKLYMSRGGPGSPNRFADWLPYEPPGAYKLYVNKVQLDILGASNFNLQGLKTEGLSTLKPPPGSDAQAAGVDKCTIHVHKGIGSGVPLIGGFLGAATGGPATLLAGVGYAACIIEKVTAWITDTDNIYRIFQVGVGAILVINGMNVLSRGVTPTVQGMAKGAARAKV